MVNHVKPTKEELEANALKALEEAEALKETDEEVVDETIKEEDVEEEDNKPEESEDIVEEVEPTDEVEEKKVEKTPEEMSKELEEKKAKLKASAQEAIILHSTNEKIQQSITQAADMPVPTNEEMMVEFPNWEDLDEFSQKMARDSVWNSRKIQAVVSVSQEFKDYNSWKSKVDTFIEDPTTVTKTPLLDGREQSFKDFAMKPTRRGVDFEDLVSAFLFNADTKVAHKGKTLDTTSSKSKESKTHGKLTAEQGSQLRESDYKKWVELSKKGMIDAGI